MDKASSTPHRPKSVFAIVRFNAKTYDRGAVIAVIGGRANAEAAMGEIRRVQESSDWVQGWRYFLEQTDLSPGTDPQEATRARQARFEELESENR
jgi:hypothetical protein